VLETEFEQEISPDVGARRSVVALNLALTEQRAPRSRLIRVLAAFAAVYLIWGSTFLGIRVAIQSIPPMLMAGTRWMIAGSCLFGFLRWRGAPRPRGRDWLVAGLIGGGIIFGGNGSVTYAEQFIPSGTVAVMVAVVPALMALMGWLSGTTSRPRLPVWIGIALATLGVAVIVRPTNLTISRGQGLAIAILLLGELMWSAASLYAVRAGQGISAFLMAATQMLCGGVFMLMTALLRGELAHFEIAAVTMRSLFAMGYLASIGSIIGFSAYLWLLRNVEATRVATYAYVNPVVAVFLGFLLGGETLAPELLAGSALVVLGIALIVTFRSRTVTTGLARSLGGRTRPSEACT
jgi:drug/metabolite transporter (DMT)-like permease